MRMPRRSPTFELGAKTNFSRLVVSFIAFSGRVTSLRLVTWFFNSTFCHPACWQTCGQSFQKLKARNPAWVCLLFCLLVCLLALVWILNILFPNSKYFLKSFVCQFHVHFIKHQVVCAICVIFTVCFLFSRPYTVWCAVDFVVFFFVLWFRFESRRCLSVFCILLSLVRPCVSTLAPLIPDTFLFPLVCVWANVETTMITHPRFWTYSVWRWISWIIFFSVIYEFVELFFFFLLLFLPRFSLLLSIGPNR